jgi:hypothetical protein
MRSCSWLGGGGGGTQIFMDPAARPAASSWVSACTAPKFSWTRPPARPQIPDIARSESESEGQIPDISRPESEGRIPDIARPAVISVGVRGV